MTRKSRELQAEGKDVINLSIGEPDFNTPEFIKEAAKKAIDDNFSHYTPVPGYQELREAVCTKLKRDNNLDYTPNQIVVSTGAKHSLINVLLSLINAGDEVILTAPFWVSYKEMVKLADGVEVRIDTNVDNDFKISPQQLEDAITDKTKLLMFNSPSNPTGSIYYREEIEALVKVLEKYPHVYILSDEIYEHINFIGEHTSFAEYKSIKDRVIVVNGLSKGYAMTGWRIGYIAANNEIAAATNKLQGQFTSGTNSIAQRAGITALLANPKDMKEMQEMRDKFKERRDLVLNLLADIEGMKINKPDGAFYVFPDISSYFGKSVSGNKIANSVDLCDYILESEYVALVPGSAFGSDNCIRISYATSNEVLKEAIKRIKRALSKIK
jgi:aspartate aminotransferase